MRAPELDEEEMQLIYNWVDEIPLSRPKKNITRDFADGGKHSIFIMVKVMMAEVFKNFFPKYVELHNYPNAHSVQQKIQNWTTLNGTNLNNQILAKVCKKLGFQVHK
jgi:hypothetical protein